MDLALNNLQSFICHKTQPNNQTNAIKQSKANQNVNLHFWKTKQIFTSEYKYIYTWVIQ